MASALWKSYFELLRDHSGECAVEALLWATQGSLWGVCCGRATLSYSGITRYFGLLRDHFGQCAVEEVLWATQGSLWPVCWATQGSLWPVCCGRAKLGYSGITLASVLWKS